MRFKSQAASLDASLSFLSTSRRCSQNRLSSRLPVTNVLLFAISASYAVNDIGGGVHKLISDFNGSLRVPIFSALCMKGQVLHPVSESL